MDLKGNMLSEKSQSQKSYVIPYDSRNDKSIEMEVDQWSSGARDRRK